MGRTFRTVLRTKWPKNSVNRQIERLHFWGLKSPIFRGSELLLDVKWPILEKHQGWNEFPKCRESICLILRNLVNLS